jgi:hypothetical protein
VTAIGFHGKPILPDSVKDLDADLVVGVLSRHGMNVSEAADELGIVMRAYCARHGNVRLSDAAIASP